MAVSAEFLLSVASLSLCDCSERTFEMLGCSRIEGCLYVPLAEPVRSHFGDCPDTHSHFCFHGTCRFLVQEDTPACVCHPGFVGMRCEHADLLAVVATNQQQQTIATLLVLSVVGCVLLILTCTLIHCCRKRGACGWSHSLPCRHEKPEGLLKGGTSCCHSETGIMATVILAQPFQT
ncbi:TGFA factor, partial [Atractosteus spatula]|nr:TGFA factor [Atractosteus spatula]